MKRVILFLFVSSTCAFAGNELGNGGDRFAQEFITIGRKMVEKIKSESNGAGINTDQLEQSVVNTMVITKDSLELNGSEVDAINHPAEKKIELNRERWAQYSFTEKESLVLHEYLGVAQIPDDKYQVSSSYTEVNSSESRQKYEMELRTGTAAYLTSRYEANPYLKRPSVGAHLGYHWSSRSTFLLALDMTRFQQSYGATLFNTNIYSATLGYRYEFYQTQALSVYGEGGLGYSMNQHEYVWKNGSSREIYEYNPRKGQYQGIISAGVLLPFTNSLRLDLKLGLRTLINPEEFSREASSFPTIFSGSIGGNFLF